MGSQGMDIILSDRARKAFPFAVECKNQERLNIWQAIAQSQENSEGLTPMVVFTRNRDDVYCSLKLDDLLDLLSKPKPPSSPFDAPSQQVINVTGREPSGNHPVFIPMERGLRIVK